MFKLCDRVLDKVTGKTRFIIDVDDHGGERVVYVVEVEDQGDQDWFRLVEEDELKKIPEHDEADDSSVWASTRF